MLGMRVINFIFSENGDMIKSAAAFTALPGGYRNNNNGNYNNLGNNGYFWSSSENNNNNAWNRKLNYNNSDVNRNNNNKKNGRSIRCVRDLIQSVSSLSTICFGAIIRKSVSSCNYLCLTIITKTKS
ncbi:MAG: hypothetical protein ISR95_02565 [Candidatus Marinimicrobia bacterium]|nr:hypothetical protein [Candidatus Neomarinimicrobiota bacterium]